MAQTTVLIDYYLKTHRIWRIIHPEDDSQIPHHKIEPGTARVFADHAEFPIEDGRPLYDLDHCADVVERVTGRRPPKTW